VGKLCFQPLRVYAPRERVKLAKLACNETQVSRRNSLECCIASDGKEGLEGFQIRFLDLEAKTAGAPIPGSRSKNNDMSLQKPKMPDVDGFSVEGDDYITKKATGLRESGPLPLNPNAHHFGSGVA